MQFTIINDQFGARMNDWGGKPGMIFANNVVYSQSQSSILFNDGSNGVTVAGNVVLGGVSGVGSGFTFGNGLSDFVSASYDATLRDVTPSFMSAVLGEGAESLTVVDDLNGDLRATRVDAGAIDG